MKWMILLAVAALIAYCSSPMLALVVGVPALAIMIGYSAFREVATLGVPVNLNGRQGLPLGATRPLARIMHDARRFCTSVEQARAGNSIAGSL